MRHVRLKIPTHSNPQNPLHTTYNSFNTSLHELSSKVKVNYVYTHTDVHHAFVPDSMHRKDSSPIMKLQQILYKTPTMVEQYSQCCSNKNSYKYLLIDHVCMYLSEIHSQDIVQVPSL